MVYVFYRVVEIRPYLIGSNTGPLRSITNDCFRQVDRMPVCSQQSDPITNNPPFRK